MSQNLMISPRIVSDMSTAMISPISSLYNNGTSASLPSISPSHSFKIGTPFIPRVSQQMRAQRVFLHSVKRMNPTTNFASHTEQLKAAREGIKELIKQTACNPILVRLGWHDAGTFDKNINDWPARGGANGSLRFEIELKHAANAGLTAALDLLKPLKEKHPSISWADLFQLASATAIEEAGGPKIPMRYGRIDVSTPEECPPEGKLPDAGPSSPADHLRKVFYRMGLSDKEIVALSGAHTLGRARPERSGWGKPVTQYTKDGPGKPGGQSWTVEWLKFDNYYFKDVKARKDADLLVLPTDAVLFEDPNFKVYAEKYAEDEEAFFHDYAHAHAKLSELGAKWEPHEGFTIDQF